MKALIIEKTFKIVNTLENLSRILRNEFYIEFHFFVNIIESIYGDKWRMNSWLG
jgi:hypothetical protein